MWIVTMTNGGTFEGERLKKTLQGAAEWCAENQEGCPLVDTIDYDGELLTRSFPKVALKAQFYLEDVYSEELHEIAAENAHRQSLTRYYEGTRF